jgi:hypothetical protein
LFRSVSVAVSSLAAIGVKTCSSCGYFAATAAATVMAGLYVGKKRLSSSSTLRCCPATRPSVAATEPKPQVSPLPMLG